MNASRHFPKEPIRSDNACSQGRSRYLIYIKGQEQLSASN